jgi:hypothetical protein
MANLTEVPTLPPIHVAERQAIKRQKIVNWFPEYALLS